MSVPCPDKRGLLGLNCSVGLGKGRGIVDTVRVWREPAVEKACRNSLPSEMDHVLLQRSWPWTVGPLAEPSCIVSQKGVGSDLHLVIAWWQL